MELMFYPLKIWKSDSIFCTTVITIILLLLVLAVTFHIAADVAEMHRRKRSFRREPSSEARTRRARKRVHRAPLLIWAICASLRPLDIHEYVFGSQSSANRHI